MSDGALKDIGGLIEIIQGIEKLDTWSSWALQVLATAGLSACNRYRSGSGRGMLACDADDREVGSGYKGPIRDSWSCHAECRLNEGRRCFGISAASALVANPSTGCSLRDGEVFASHLPDRNEMKELIQAKVAGVYYVIDRNDEDAWKYLRRYKQKSNSGFFVRKIELSAKLSLIVSSFWKLIEKAGRQLTFEEVGILKALINSRRSNCIYHKIGCVAFDKEEVVIGYGFNGPVSRDVHCVVVGCNKDSVSDGGEDDDHQPRTCIGAHAEKNMVTKSACKTLLRGATIFLSQSPCFECFKVLAHLGVARVVYFDIYKKRDVPNGCDVDELSDVMELALEKGIEVRQFVV